MAAKGEMMMTTEEGPSGGGVILMLEMRVLDWILLGFDQGPSNDKVECADEGAGKWGGACPTSASTSVWQR
jgi:hypothetical protein